MTRCVHSLGGCGRRHTFVDRERRGVTGYASFSLELRGMSHAFRSGSGADAIPGQQAKVAPSAGLVRESVGKSYTLAGVLGRRCSALPKRTGLSSSYMSVFVTFYLSPCARRRNVARILLLLGEAAGDRPRIKEKTGTAPFPSNEFPTPQTRGSCPARKGSQMKQLTMLYVSAGILALLSGSASADVVSANGNTATGDYWNRPIALSGPPVSLSGKNVQFEVEQLYVDLAGDYDFKSTATSPVGWDNYTFLYQYAFDPLAPLTNVLVGNDDLGSVLSGVSGFSIVLLANTNYFFVNTGFSTSDAGEFTKEIRGPGTIHLNASVPTPTSAPEPMPLALVGIGLAGLGLSRRKRKPTIHNVLLGPNSVPGMSAPCRD